MSDMFYGWYFRCQSDASTMAVIPAVHISGSVRSCSIQVITEKGAWNKTFPIHQFRIDRKKGIMQIGENLFSKKGIRLNVLLLEQKASLLHAPKHGEMTRMVLEDPSCKVEYTLTYRKRVLLKVATDRAAFECECMERKKMTEKTEDGIMIIR